MKLNGNEQRFIKDKQESLQIRRTNSRENMLAKIQKGQNNK